MNSITAGQVLTIVVGQAGGDNPTYDGGTGGGGGTFVISDNNNTPLVVAGGGSGQGGDTHAQNAFRAIAEETDTPTNLADRMEREDKATTGAVVDSKKR